MATDLQSADLTDLPSMSFAENIGIEPCRCRPLQFSRLLVPMYATFQVAEEVRIELTGGISRLQISSLLPCHSVILLFVALLRVELRYSESKSDALPLCYKAL